MTPEWFRTLDGEPVLPGSLPAEKNYVILVDDAYPTVVDILRTLEPANWEQLVLTNATTFDALGAHSGAFSSRSEARRNGFEGPLFHGLEYAGSKTRGFWYWCPTHLPVPPTMSRKRLETGRHRAFLIDMGWTTR